MKSRLVCLVFLMATVLLMMGMTIVMAWTSMEMRTIPPFVVGNAMSEAAQIGVYDYAFKFDNWGSGTVFPWTETYEGNTITVNSNDGKYFSWTSTKPISAVIVKGGSAVNIFYYNPPATSDTGLYAPYTESGQPAAVSHVTFCWNAPPDQEIPEVPLGTVMAATAMIFAFGAYFALRKPKSISL